MSKENKEEIIETEVKEVTISKEDQKYLKRICMNDSLQASNKLDTLKKYFDKDESGISELIEMMGLSLKSSQFSKAKFHTLKKSNRYILSSAQTASPVNKKVLNNIEAYAKMISAEIGIIATRYRNPTSTWVEEGDVWDESVHKYLTAQRQELHPNLLLLADLKIQATSPNPTNGVEIFGEHRSIIVGAPKIEMKSIPVLENKIQKFIHSTGSVTKPNFTETVAGGKAAEQHCYGFVIVEIENDEIVHIRNVEVDEEGNFNDLKYRVENGIVLEEEVECLVWGDSHFAQKEERVTEAFRKLCKDLKINTSVLHDVWDSESINVHNMKNPIVQHKLMLEGKDDLKKELKQMHKELKWFESNMVKTLVVASNHDDMLDRALVQSDWRDNLKNAILFVNFLGIKLSGKAPNGLIPYEIKKKYSCVIPLGIEDSFILNGVELAMHGHKGPNGARGNINAFSKLGNSIIGHSHSPQIKGNCYQVGISCSMKHGYNQGLSGWAYSGCTLNRYGKRQMIVLNQKSLTYTTLY